MKDVFFICEICIKNCHAGHDTYKKSMIYSISKKFCKCGEQASNCKMLKHEEPIFPPSSPPLVHQDLEHEKIETSDLPTQNSNSIDIPIINELRSPIVAHFGLNVETLPNQELKEMADINESESKNDKETKICFECDDKASYVLYSYDSLKMYR